MQRPIQLPRKTLLVICLVVIIASQVNTLWAAPIQVFLLGGQSNMDGHALTSEIPDSAAELRDPQNDVLIYLGQTHRTDPPVPGNMLVPLQPGATLAGGGAAFGPELSFGKAMAEAMPGETIALIKHAYGGSYLATDWNPSTGPVYAAFQQTVADGLAALVAEGYTPEIAGMLWMQGEHDVKVTDYRNAYESNLTNFIAEIRSEYGNGLPFVIGQLSIHQTGGPPSRNPETLAVVRAAQANVAAADPRSGLVVTDDFPLNSDDLHFSAVGQIALGAGMAESYLAIVPEPSAGLLSLVGLGTMLVSYARIRRQNPFKSLARNILGKNAGIRQKFLQGLVP